MPGKKDRLLAWGAVATGTGKPTTMGIVVIKIVWNLATRILAT